MVRWIERWIKIERERERERERVRAIKRREPERNGGNSDTQL